MKHTPASFWKTAMLWAVFFIPIAWAALLFADTYTPGQNLFALLDAFAVRLETPLILSFNEYSIRAVVIAAVLYCGGISAWYALRGNTRPGEEHGTARWGSPQAVRAKYADRRPDGNIILTKHVRLGLDSRRHRRNLNVLVVGGSGSGKTRFYAKPNIINNAGACSFLCTDPKGEILRATGGFLKSLGYDVKVLDLINMDRSDAYNPFAYIVADEDIFKLIGNLIRNTTPKNTQSTDPFWEKSETAFLSALFLYIHHETPPEEQNFDTVMFLIDNAGASEQDEDQMSPLDILFADLEEENPDHIAVRQYNQFRKGEGKTLKSVIISAAVRLAVFNLPKLQAITNRDDLDIERLGEQKRAIFAVIPDNDDTFSFLIGMLYTQAFQALYRCADYDHGGRLPIHVRLIMDEFSNVANLSPDDFLRVLATMRSREISVSIIVQNLSQLKKQFGNEAWESVPGNCDTFLYLGGNESSTHEYISKALGKSTIDTRTSGQTKGRSGSYTQNYQNAGRELLTPDEVRLLDNKNAILLIRGERPLLDEKFDLLRHPNVKYTEDGKAAPYIHKGASIPDLSRDDIGLDIGNLNDYEIL